MQKHISFVIIDSTLSIDDKVHILLHEIGHIDLHFSDTSLFDDISSVERENQAEIFAYSVFRLKKFKPFFAFSLKSFFKYSLILIAFLMLCSYKSKDSTTPLTFKDPVPVESSLQDDEANVVYVMPNGEVFHKKDCSYLNPLKAKQYSIEKAKQSSLRPCSRCNPEPN